MALEREREREMQAEGGGRTSKGRDAKYTHPIFGSTCASISQCVGASQEETESSTFNRFTLRRGSRRRRSHRKMPLAKESIHNPVSDSTR